MKATVVERVRHDAEIFERASTQEGNHKSRGLSPEMEAKVIEALDQIQFAQNLINRAAQSLCPVPGFGREWSASIAVHDKIKAYWYRVNARFQALREAARPLTGKCPACGSSLPADGSCCDECHWVKPQ